MSSFHDQYAEFFQYNTIEHGHLNRIQDYFHLFHDQVDQAPLDIDITLNKACPALLESPVLLESPPKTTGSIKTTTPRMNNPRQSGKIMHQKIEQWMGRHTIRVTSFVNHLPRAIQMRLDAFSQLEERRRELKQLLYGEKY